MHSISSCVFTSSHLPVEIPSAGNASQSNQSAKVRRAAKALCATCQQPMVHDLLCNRCKGVYYCGQECQILAWEIHKISCRPFDERDALGLTATHHAILAGKADTLTRKLRHRLDAIKDSFEGTPRDLERLINSDIPGDDALVCELENETGIIKQITQTEFYRMTGRKYFNGYRATPEVIIEMHKQASRSEKQGEFDLKPDNPSVIQFEKHSPTLYLRKNAKGRIDVIAGEDIPKNTIICFYTGDINLSSLITYESHRHRIGHVDPSLYTNEGGLIQDGPLNNCLHCFIAPYRGLSYVIAITSLTTIKKGTPLQTCFGPGHATKIGKYDVEPQHLEELIKICNSEEFRQLVKSFTELGDLPSCYLPSLHPLFYFQYSLCFY
jgi:hypothetical protein